MLFCCLWRNVKTSCRKHFAVLSCHQQTPPLTTSEVSQFAEWWSDGVGLTTPAGISINSMQSSSSRTHFMNHKWSATNRDKPPFSFVGTGFDNVGHCLGLATMTQIFHFQGLPFMPPSTFDINWLQI